MQRLKTGIYINEGKQPSKQIRRHNLIQSILHIQNDILFFIENYKLNVTYIVHVICKIPNDVDHLNFTSFLRHK